MVSRRVTIAAGMVMVLVLAAGPAWAALTAGFIGVPAPALAEVGDPAASVCAKAGSAVAGAGLAMPQFKDVIGPFAGPLPGKDRVYSLAGPVTDVVFGAGVIGICGYITSVAGIGPRCGLSKGYGGQGFMVFPAAVVKLSNITWKVSAGGILPITGRAHLMDAGVKVKASRLLGLAVAQGGLLCTVGWSPLPGAPKAPGATLLTVSAVYAIDQSGFSREWHDITNSCAGWPGVDDKDDGPSSAANIWGDKPAKPAPKGPRPKDNGPLPICMGG